MRRLTLLACCAAIVAAQALTASATPSNYHPFGLPADAVIRLPGVLDVPGFEPAIASSPLWDWCSERPVCNWSGQIPDLRHSNPADPFRPDLDADGFVLDCCDGRFDVDVLARGFFLDDQRIEWTGLEATFGAEAAIAPVYRRTYGPWETAVIGDFYVNQRFDKNILVDTAERRSYLANWETDTLEISNLLFTGRRGRFSFGLGKMETPFGRRYFRLFSNQRLDAPFIRGESVAWRETGFLVRYEHGWLVADAALTNGAEDKDTNSSKAGIARVGIQHDNFAAGASVKFQDGIGSEWQKVFNNHVGADFMVRRGRWVLSGEVIYDEYGFRRAGFNPLAITWERSIYGRDLAVLDGVPLTAVGWYIDLGYHGERAYLGLNYGENHPRAVGDPIHDQVIRRWILKGSYAVTPRFEWFGVVMLESDGFIAQNNRTARGEMFLGGVQAKF